MKYLGYVLILSIAGSLGFSGCSNENYDSYLASAKQSLAENAPSAAAIQLRNALQQRPDSSEARYLLGQALLAGGDVDAAAIELAKATELGHPMDEVVPPLARALLAQQQPKEIISRFSETFLVNPQADADLKTTLAAAYEMVGAEEPSRKTLASIHNSVGDFPPALVLESRLAARSADYKAALELVEKALAADPNLADGWRLKGDYLFNSKAETAKVVEAYQRALAVRKTEVGAHAGILNALIAAGNINGAGAHLEQMRKALPGHPETRRFEMLLAYQKGDFKHAREIGQLLLKAAPGNPQVLQLAGAVEYQLQSFSVAEEYLSRALSASPGSNAARRMLAQTYLRTGQSAKAVALLAPVLRNEDVDTETLSLAGEAYLQNGDLKQAEQVFQLAAKTNPDEARGRTVLAQAKIWRGDVQSGFDELRTLAASDAGTGADVALIRAHLRRREFKEALAAIDNLDRKQPDKPFAPNLRGLVALIQNDVAGARRNLELALKREPGFFPAAATLATLDLAADKPDQAQRRFDDMLAADPKNYRAALAKAEIRERTGASKDEVAKILQSAIESSPDASMPKVALVEFHLRSGNPKPALTLAQSAVAANPESPELVEALGRVQLALGDHSQAIQTYDRLAKQLRQSPLPHQRLAEAHIANKDLRAAESSLRRALELAPDMIATQRRLVEVLMASNKPKDAMSIAQNLQRRHPEQSAGFLLEGDILAAEKKWEGAVKAYRSGLAKGNEPELAIRTHTALSALGDRNQAGKFAANWRKDHPSDAAFVAHLGSSALLQGDYLRAEQYFKETLRLQPGHAQSLNNLAWIANKQGKPGARPLAEKAVALEPNNAAYLDTLSAVLESEQDIAKALAIQQKAVDLLPGNPGLRLRLAKLCIKKGDKAAARQHLEYLAPRVSESFPGANEVEPLLNSL